MAMVMANISEAKKEGNFALSTSIDSAIRSRDNLQHAISELEDVLSPLLGVEEPSPAVEIGHSEGQSQMCERVLCLVDSLEDCTRRIRSLIARVTV